MNVENHGRDDRLGAVMEMTASAARPARPWGEFVVDARRSLMRRRFLAVSIAASVIALGVVFAGQFEGFGSNNQTGVPGGVPSSGDTSSPSSANSPEPGTSEAACGFPDERPTYLPWLAEGEEVGSPIMDKAEAGDGSSDFATLLWPRVEGDPESDYVSLFTQSSEGVEAHGEVVDVHMNGEKGRFELAPGDGDATITWLAGSEPCNITVLTLRTSGWDDSRLETEIKRVARSLDPI